MKVEWLKVADEDVRRLYHFLADLNLQAAERAVNTIINAIYDLSRNPEIGRRPYAERSYREWPVKFSASAYIIRYTITDNTVVILRIWHSREDS